MRRWTGPADAGPVPFFSGDAEIQPRMSRTVDSLFAVCAPGLEPVTEAELLALGCPARAAPGGVAFPGSDAELYRASLELRTATRVLLRLGEFRARTFAELERHAARLPWTRVLGPGARVRLRVSSSKSKLYHEGAVAERLLAVIEAGTGAGAAPARDAMGEDETDDAQLVVVRLLRDQCTVSADTSGNPLYMRGYRQALAKAPLRETLAAGMLLAAGWPGTAPLLDPLCGSGTIAIEAALLARGVPPALANGAHEPRRFRFQEWPGHQPGRFDAAVRSARAAIRVAAAAPIVASDRNAGAIRAARANAERAGVSDDIEFAVRPLAAARAAAPGGWLVTNPPYGVRVGGRAESRALAHELARLVRSTLAGWVIVALAADEGVRRALGPGTVELLRTRNGGIPVRLLRREPGPETAPSEGA